MRKATLFILFLSGTFCLASDEKSGFELPEVTIHGKDISEYELPGGYASFDIKAGDAKGKIMRSEMPGVETGSKGESFRSISLSAGRYDTFTSGVDLAGMSKYLDYLFQFQYAETDGYRDHSSEELYLTSGSAGFQLNERNRLSGEFAFFKKLMQLPGPVTLPTPLAVRDNESTDFRVGLANDSLNGFHSDSSIYGVLSRMDEDPIAKSFDNQVLGFSSNLSYEFVRGDFDISSERLQDYYSYLTFALSGGVEQWEIYQDIYLDASLELDHYEGLDERVNPRMGATWYASDTFAVFVEIGRHFSVRNWTESYLSEGYVEGNLEELRPQRDLKTAVGISYAWMENLNSSLRLFQNNYKDMLVWQDLNSNGLFTLVNQPEATVRGAEINIQYHLRDTFAWNTSITLQDPDGQDFVGDEIPYVPKVAIQSGIEWQTPLKIKFGSDMSYTGSQFITFADESQIQDYILWNMNISYEWKNATFFSKILNVLDQRYDYFFGYPGPDTQYQFGVIWEF